MQYICCDSMISYALWPQTHSDWGLQGKEISCLCSLVSVEPFHISLLFSLLPFPEGNHGPDVNEASHKYDHKYFTMQMQFLYPHITKFCTCQTAHSHSSLQLITTNQSDQIHTSLGFPRFILKRTWISACRSTCMLVSRE